MFSTCSELTPRAPIPDGRMERFMHPWSEDADWCWVNVVCSTEMQKAASRANVLVLIFTPAVLIFGLPTHAVIYTKKMLCFFGLSRHKISRASLAGTDVACIISTNVKIFGVSSQNSPFSTSLLNHGSVSSNICAHCACFVKSQNECHFWRFHR